MYLRTFTTQRLFLQTPCSLQAGIFHIKYGAGGAIVTSAAYVDGATHCVEDVQRQGEVHLD